MEERYWGTEEEMKAFVASCEARFDAVLTEAARKIAEDDKLRVATLAGPTCAGKTTTAEKLKQVLAEHGKTAKMISIDDFFRDRDFEAEREMSRKNIPVDYDSIAAIHFNELRDCIEGIFDGKTVNIPIYDFTTRKRAGYTPFSRAENELVIFEGIQAIYPEVTALFSEHYFKSIYISVEQGLDLGDVSFDRHEIRLLRRLVRDYRFRSADGAFTLFLWKGVRENEERSIIPYESGADISINSFLPCEIYMIAPLARNVLAEVPRESIFYREAQHLLAKLEGIPTIPETCLPEHALYREFLG